MSYTALYRKYRPSTFSQVVGQEHITQTLKAQLSAGKIFHAYLFTGTRGTGKTSCAKILSKAVNCLNPIGGDPCGQCEACKAIAGGEVMDIVEIDAASNNSVDNIRELREQIQFTPANAKYRVYIIDEVHMLTISAFNALLKTLEEPPAHVIFVLATTEVHKLPATILSRCQRFDFKRIEPAIIKDQIQFVADNEDFTVSDNAALMIASIADGGMRDALSVLDLCVAASNDVTEDIVASVCGMAGDEYLVKFADYIKAGNCGLALELINELYNNSVDMLRLCQELINHFRNLLIVKTVKGQRPIVCSSAHLQVLENQALQFEIADIMRVLRFLQEATANMQTGNRRAEMELTLVKLCSPRYCDDFESLERRVAALENRTQSVAKVADICAPIEDSAVPIAQEEEMPLPEELPIDEHFAEPLLKPAEDNLPDGKLEGNVWKNILAELSKSVPLISGILNGSSAYVDGQFLLIETENRQFAELMNGKNNLYREKLRKAVETVTGASYKLGPYRKKQEENSDDPLLPFKNKLKELEIPKRS